MTSRLQISSGRKIRLIQMLWGGMDALYVAFLVYGSLKRGRVPILGDFYSGLESMQCWGGGLEFFNMARRCSPDLSYRDVRVVPCWKNVRFISRSYPIPR